jgi:hypothetical protein
MTAVPGHYPRKCIAQPRWYLVPAFRNRHQSSFHSLSAPLGWSNGSCWEVVKAIPLQRHWSEARSYWTLHSIAIFLRLELPFHFDKKLWSTNCCIFGRGSKQFVAEPQYFTNETNCAKNREIARSALAYFLWAGHVWSHNPHSLCRLVFIITTTRISNQALGCNPYCRSFPEASTHRKVATDCTTIL